MISLAESLYESPVCREFRDPIEERFPEMVEIALPAKPPAANSDRHSAKVRPTSSSLPSFKALKSLLQALSAGRDRQWSTLGSTINDALGL